MGLAGNKSFAGHWSETPNYEEKRKALYAMLLDETISPNPLKITHLVLPKEHIPKGRPPEDYGVVLYQGTELVLIRTR